MRTNPALQQFIEEFVGGSFNVALSNPSVTTAASKLCSNNYERMALTIINTGGTNVTLLPSNAVTATMGIIIGANGGSVSFDAQEDLALVGFDWWGICSGGSSACTVVETIRYSATPENLGGSPTQAVGT